MGGDRPRPRPGAIVAGAPRLCLRPAGLVARRLAPDHRRDPRPMAGAAGSGGLRGINSKGVIARRHRRRSNPGEWHAAGLDCFAPLAKTTSLVGSGAGPRRLPRKRRVFSRFPRRIPAAGRAARRGKGLSRDYRLAFEPIDRLRRGLMDGSEVAKAPRAAAPKRAPGQIGVVTQVSGFKLSCIIFGPSTPGGSDSAYASAQIGALVKIPTFTSTAFGFIASLTFEFAGTDMQIAIADIDLLGELTGDGAKSKFIRGISVYPVLGAPILNATGEDIKLIYAKPNSWTLQIGSLHQDAGTPAYLMSQEFLSKHSAIVGTTGSGKSCALTLILRTLLTAHPNGHVVMLDPHGEYATAFDDIAELITPDTMQLPYWLLSFEEIVEVLCSADPIARSREAPILKEVIMAAKQDFLGAGAAASALTVDTPTPYRLTSVLQRRSDAMGKLDRPDSSLPYLRLMTTIENLRKDPRYAFMFEGLTVRDNMGEILSLFLRIPVSGKPITILDISAVPSEIVNVVVSVLARLI